MTQNQSNLSSQIHNFFEQPKGFLAYLVQFLIFIFIITSVVNVYIEFFNPEFFSRYENLFHLSNWIILLAFTIEYVLRVSTAPKKLAFVKKPLNVVDFLAIAPNYLELLLPMVVETTELRVLRLIRLLRFMRVLRVLRLFRYGSFLKRIFQYQNTIFEAITPILIIFIAVKGFIWLLETYHFWIPNADLGELFAIIGFALGIILSQKIGVSYDKFIRVEEALIRLYGNLRSLTLILNAKKRGFGTQVTKRWVEVFLTLLKDAKADNYQIHGANESLYEAITKFEPIPADLTNMQTAVYQDAAFCLSKKVRLTPKAYDTLLHQATILYLALIAVFIPGLTGVISVFAATYILYGMYNLTQDLDSIAGGEFNLISIDISELEYLVEN